MENDRVQRTLKMSRKRFIRRTGVCHETFHEMLHVLEQREQGKIKSGRPAALSLLAQLLLALEFWREYRTFYHLGVDWGIHETTVHRTVQRVENALVGNEKFALPGKKALKTQGNVLEAVLVDVSETPCERPRRGQKAYYSGKKKRHTLKSQVLVCAYTLEILCVTVGKGATHDLKLFRDSEIRIHSETALIGDAGYQGIGHDHGHALTPHKKTRNQALSKAQKQENRVLSSFRQPVEHVIRRLKVFRVLKGIYRHRRKRFLLRLHLLAALVNRRIAAVA